MALLASETVGTALDLSRVAYGDMDAAGRHMIIHQDWLAPDQASLAGTHDFETYGSYIESLRRGEDVVIDDIASDPRTADQATSFRSIAVRSLVNLPLMDRGRLKVVFCLNQDEPRAWTADEVLFARRVMDRTEVEIARRAAEHRLRDMNASLEKQVAAQTAERDRIWQLSGDMLGVADDQGIWLSINPAWTRTLGWRQEEIVGHTSEWMEHPDDVAKTRSEIGHLAAGRETFEFENRFRSKERGYRTLSWTAVPENGLLYCVARDVTDERAQAVAITEQSAAQERTWHFSPDLLSVIDMRSTLFDRVNPAWTAALGWRADEIEGASYQGFVHADDVGASLSAFDRVRAGSPVLRFENRYRTKAGEWRRLSWVAFPEGDKLYSSARDITAEAEQAEALSDANELIAAKERAEQQQRELQNEMAHRIKNTLAMVKAIVSQTMRHADTKEEAAVTIDQRIAALSSAQDLLRQTTYASATIHEVVRGALKVHLESDDRVTIEGVRLDLPSQAALGLSLAIHELATNAAKYGALSNETGHIRISWRHEADDAFRFEWREAGGPEVVKPARRGFGSRLTNQIVPSYFDGSGETAFTPDGLCYVLAGTLPRETPPSAEPSEARPVADHE
ncbi:PAS domain-containing protein [Aureimonas flava]|nr:PAS domain-containing protein [Aureimonas flava]